MSARVGRHHVLTAPRGRCGGFTLMEVVVTVAIISVLAVGVSSAIMLATRALPGNQGRNLGIIQAGRIADQIASELQNALHVTERGQHAITFTVADRDGNGSPETIRYAFSGVPGDPLTRRYNRGAEVPVLEDVRRFDLAYDLKSVTEEYPGPGIEGPEQLVSSYTGGEGLGDFLVSQVDWIGQHIVPSLPVGAIGWRVSRFTFYAQRAGKPNEGLWVQVRLPDQANGPSETIIDQALCLESTLDSSYLWQHIWFSGGARLNPGAAVCMVLKHWGGKAPSAYIQHDTSGGSGRLKTANAGFTWNYASGKSMRYYLYAKVTMPGPSQTATRQYVTGVRMALQVGDDADSRIDTAVRTLNAPEALSAVWEVDFDTDPTRLDMNADGAGDWVILGGGSFNPGSLIGGIWHADAALQTYPNNDFTELTTAEVRFRSTSVGGDGAVFWINADFSGGTYAPIFAYLQLQADGTQNLTVYHKLNELTKWPLVAVSGLDGDFVELRLLIDPDQDTVNVKVDGRDKGTFPYNTLAQSNDNRFVMVLESGSAAEFDYVRVRVGGNNP